MYSLRDYQDELIDGIKTVFSKIKKAVRIAKILVVAVTRSGKTVVMAFIARKYHDVGKSVLVITHRDIIFQQTFEKFVEFGMHPGQIKGNSTITKNEIQIAMVKTLKLRIKRQQRIEKDNRISVSMIPDPDIILLDEAHHAPAPEFLFVLDYYKDKIIIGFTATACRLDNKPLYPIFTSLVLGWPMRQMIDEYWITDYVHLCPKSPLEKIKIKMKGKDYDKESQTDKMTTIESVGNIIKYYKEFLNGLQTICFCCNMKHSEIMKEKFDAAGYPAQIISAKSKNRKKIIDDYRCGKYPILISMDIVAEGFDVPICYGILSLRKTKSTSLYLQQLSRCLTPIYAPGYDLEVKSERKKALENGKPRGVIIDFVGNYFEHGKLDDYREWTLDSKVKKIKPKTTILKKTCPQCEFDWEIFIQICPHCGYDFTKEIKRQKEVQIKELEDNLTNVHDIEGTTASNMAKMIVKIKEYPNKNKAMFAVLHTSINNGEGDMRKKIKAMCHGLEYDKFYHRRVEMYLRKKYGERLDMLL